MVQNINIMWRDCSYPSTKLQEGNVLVCLQGVLHVTSRPVKIVHLDLTTQGPRLSNLLESGQLAFDFL